MPPPSSTLAPALWRQGLSPQLRTTCLANKPLASQLIRHYASGPINKSKLLRELKRSGTRSSDRATPEMTMSESQRLAQIEYFKQSGGPLFAGTFVPLPLTQAPRGRDFLRYQFYRARQWLGESLAAISFKLSSMPKWTARPKFKIQRRKIALTGKAMYQEMMEAFASGDRVAIQKLCLYDFGKRLLTVVDRRDPRERVRFEVLSYNQRLFYPRVVSYQVHQHNPADKNTVMEQAVVAIASTQQVSRYDGVSGQTTPGSERIQDKVEYVVVCRLTNQTTFESGEWRLWGTVQPTTLEGYLTEKTVLEKEQANRAGWKDKARN